MGLGGDVRACRRVFFLFEEYDIMMRLSRSSYEGCIYAGGTYVDGREIGVRSLRIGAESVGTRFQFAY